MFVSLLASSALVVVAAVVVPGDELPIPLSQSSVLVDCPHSLSAAGLGVHQLLLV